MAMTNEAHDIPICNMPGCGRPVKHKMSGLCGRCYNFLHRWGQRTPTEQMMHLQKLVFWEKRAKAMFTPPNRRSHVRRVK